MNRKILNPTNVIYFMKEFITQARANLPEGCWAKNLISEETEKALYEFQLLFYLDIMKNN